MKCAIIFSLFALVVALEARPMTRAGGFSAERPANEHVHEVVSRVQGQFQYQAKRDTVAQFTAVVFRSQVVAGTNYLVKVHLGSGEYVHLSIFEPLPNENHMTELKAFEMDKKFEDSLAPIHAQEKPVEDDKPAMGGLSKEMSADDHMHKIVSQVRPSFESQAALSTEEFTAITYKKQVVAGTIYFVKVHMGSNQYAHLRIFEHLPPPPTSMVIIMPRLDAFQLDKVFEDEIEFFEIAAPTEPAPIMGGLSEEMPANDDIQGLVSMVQGTFEQLAAIETTDFSAMSYRTQVVNGMIFYVKVHHGNGNYAHLRIYKPLGEVTIMEPTLQAFQLDKQLTDPIEFFQVREEEPARPPVGAPTDEFAADQRIQNVVRKVQPQFQRRTMLSTSEFTAVTYKKQIVAGTIYFVKVHLGNGAYSHLRIYEPLTRPTSMIVVTPILQSYQLDKTHADPIEIFA